MKFLPKSDSELNNMNLIDPGIYPFEIVSASDKLSRNGNEMIEIKLKIWDSKGCEKIIFDYLLEAMSYKLKHFAESTGLIEEYEKGELIADDCIGKQGILELIIQKGKQKPDGGFYQDKNSVKDYFMTEKGAVKHAVSDAKSETFDDTMPF
jgi:hypothetical protein